MKLWSRRGYRAAMRALFKKADGGVLVAIPGWVSTAKQERARVRAFSRLFRKAVTAVGLRGDAAWSAIYGEAHLMPETVYLRSGTIQHAYNEVRPGGTIVVVPSHRERFG